MATKAASESAANQECRLSKPRKTEEVRLVFPPVVDLQATTNALNRVIETWLIPRLLEEYLRERGA